MKAKDLSIQSFDTDLEFHKFYHELKIVDDARV